MKKYITVMFPYPSGAGLHVGHWYNYSIADSYAKIQKYKGYEIFQPFGYDSFGLPTENYARKIGRDPKEVTDENIKNFEIEMNRMNTSFDSKFSTHNPSYYKWTQWIFTKLHEKGLAYKSNREQDYCTSCETVLAREQVKDNKCERCETTIVKKELNQWFFKITDYKQRLIDDLDKVDYPEKTKKQQINWLNNLTDWCVSRQRKWGCPIPIDDETDTLDTFVDSSFYTIRYCDPYNENELVDFNKAKQVDVYIGGSEHSCMHLIYARFICKFLFDIGVVNFDEPFKKVIHQGMILAEDGQKMSKSKGNVVNPDNYDPQLLRMYLMFINHYFEGGKWQDNGYKGCERFRNKFMTWINKESINIDDNINIENFKNKVIDYFESWKTNKVVSEWMTFYNQNKNKTLTKNQKDEIVEFFNMCF